LSLLLAGGEVFPVSRRTTHEDVEDVNFAPRRIQVGAALSHINTHQLFNAMCGLCWTVKKSTELFLWITELMIKKIHCLFVSEALKAGSRNAPFFIPCTTTV